MIRPRLLSFLVALSTGFLSSCGVLHAADGGDALKVKRNGTIISPVTTATFGSANGFMTLSGGQFSTGGNEFTSDGGNIDLGGGALISVGNGGISFSGTGLSDTLTTLSLNTTSTPTFSGLALKGATSGTITIIAPTFAGTHTLTLSLAGDITMTLPGTSFTVARTDAGNNFNGTQTFSGTVALNGGFNFSGASSFTGTIPSANLPFAYGRVSGSDWTNTSATFSDVTGLSFAVAANENWTADVDLDTVGPSGGGVGMKYRVTGPTVASVTIEISGYGSSSASGMSEVQRTFSATPGSTFSTGAAMTAPLHMHIVVIADGTHSGTVQVQANNAGASGTATIKANSDLSARKTN